jgi:AraC-like DNA-binding protein
MLIDPRTFRRVVWVREQLLANGEVGVATLAAQVGMSPSRLIRVFAALFGTTPHQLRTQARLDRARQLLAHGEDVTRVCMEVGFSSLGSFSALFTRWTGTPPSRYRKIVQVAAAVNDAPLVPGCLGMLACLPRNFREAHL